MSSRRDLQKSLRTNFNPGPRDRLNRIRLRARQALHLPSLWMGGGLRNPVFIIGAPRSGTSLLYSILRTSSRFAHWPGEAHEVWEADFHPALTGWESNILRRTDAYGLEAERIRRSFFLVTGSRHRLIDKTPRNALRVAFIDEVFPDARFIFLKRDGRDNVNSLINAWRTPRYRTYALPEPHSLDGVDPRWWKFTLYPGWRDDADGPLEVVAARQWQLSNEHALDDLATVEEARRFEIAYEDLVDDPEVRAGELFEWLGLDYEAASRAEAFRSRSAPINVVTPPERGKWRRENPDEIGAIVPLIAPTMKRLGYGDTDDQ
ncbi:MAG TPA: sulfotransferase [Actinomycetota bacterium]|nr:sulfotransferase [Actinomycetota bacterium]